MAKKLSKEEFIKKAKLVHCNKYDYSKVEYINTRTKVCIICPEHGEFWQTPHSHINKRGCPICWKLRKSKNMTLTNDEFIKKAKQTHGDKYDYSKVEYINTRTKVCIICPEHGEFWQIPNIHIRGSECPKCVNQYHQTTEEFIEKAKKIHGNKYDYSKVNYKSKQKSIIISCPIHGEFSQLPQNHLRGSGCPKCAVKKNLSEQKLYNFLLSIFSESEIKIHYKNISMFGFKSIDFYIEKYKIAIEHQGRQHFMPVKFCNKKNQQYSDFIHQQYCDQKKLEECNALGIKMIYFSYDKTVPNNYLSNKVYKDENELLSYIKEIINK